MTLVNSTNIKLKYTSNENKLKYAHTTSIGNQNLQLDQIRNYEFIKKNANKIGYVSLQ